MKTKIEIKSVFGKVLFSYEKENNAIKETLEEAVKRGAYLGGADLGGAYLYGAYLGGAYLHGAYLHGAYLHGADLHGADLHGADLHGADLGGAYLGGADLHGADLGGADLGDWGRLCSCSDILCVSPIGSRNGCTTIFHTDKGLFVQCGCFRGTLDEFASKVKDTHGENKHARDYLALVEFVKVKYNVDR